jgi:hypothetical protein
MGGGGEYPKGGDIPRVFAPWGAILLGYSPPGAIYRPPFERGGANLLGGGGERPLTTAWANSSTFLKILSCPPPPKYQFAPKCPSNSEAWRRHCSFIATRHLTVCLSYFRAISYPEPTQRCYITKTADPSSRLKSVSYFHVKTFGNATDSFLTSCNREYPNADI